MHRKRRKTSSLLLPRARRKRHDRRRKSAFPSHTPYSYLLLLSAAWAICLLLSIVYLIVLHPPADVTNPTESMSLLPFLDKEPPIPIPPPKPKVSVILMNFTRPRMIRESSLLPTLLSHPSVDEVILLHGKSETAFEFIHPKVINVDARAMNERMGLALRFYYCQLVQNDWVLHVDDDMEFSTRTLTELLSEFSKNTHRIVGKWGRDYNPRRGAGRSFQGYWSHNSHKTSEVILTKFMVMEQATCSAFFQYAHLIWEDLVIAGGEKPLWNGEDIFMSLVANHVYADGRINNYAMDWLTVSDANDSLKDYTNGKLDISGGFGGVRIWEYQWWLSLLRRNRHYSYRGNLWKAARDRLQALRE